MADGGDVLVHVEVVGDDLLLAGRLARWHLDRLQGAVHGLGDLADAVHRSLEAEHLVDDVQVREEIGDRPRVRLALDAVEQEDRSAVEVLLQPRDLQVGVDLHVGLEHVALGLEELERTAERGDVRLDSDGLRRLRLGVGSGRHRAFSLL